MTLAKRIREYRARHNLTCEKLGEKIGASGGAVSTWGSGKVLPREIFKTRLNLLFEEEKRETKNGWEKGSLEDFKRRTINSLASPEPQVEKAEEKKAVASNKYEAAVEIARLNVKALEMILKDQG